MKTSKKKDKPLFTGVVTALVTPFKKGQVDFKSLKRLVRHQLDNGVQGLVIGGTTGESPTLEWKEVEKIFKFVKSEVSKQVPLLVGTGTNNTLATVKKTKDAQKWRADGALVVAPYYNKPPQRGIVEHYKAVARAVKFPVVLYNVPGRTITSISEESTIILSKIKNVAGIKEASGNMEYIENVKGKVPKNFLLTSGDDATAVDFNLRGGHGIISVISHLIPKELVSLTERARGGETSVIMEYARFEKLSKLLGAEANPIPVKMALYQMGIIDKPDLRLPLMKLSDEHASALKAELKHLGLI